MCGDISKLRHWKRKQLCWRGHHWPDNQSDKLVEISIAPIPTYQIHRASHFTRSESNNVQYLRIEMDQIKVESMESANAAKKSVINQMSTHVWNLFAKTNLFALCCVGAFLSLVSVISTYFTEPIQSVCNAHISFAQNKITIIFLWQLKKRSHFFFRAVPLKQFNLLGICI